jgi:hypothetical protein
MKFLIVYATLSLGQPIELELSQIAIPKIKIHKKKINMALNPYDNSTKDEKALAKMGYLNIENNVEFNYVYKQ